jgi:hypothetical protein
MPLNPVKVASLSLDRLSLAWSETITPKLGQKNSRVFAAHIPFSVARFSVIISSNSDHLHKLFYSPYTGLADLGVNNTPIDWAAKVLSLVANLDVGLSLLKDRASELMNSHYISRFPARQRRLAFISAGFAHHEEDGKLVRRPVHLIISNYMNTDGTWLEQPYQKFSIFTIPLTEESTFKLFIAGQPLEKDGEKEIKTLIECFQKRQGGVRPETIGRLLTRAIQKTAGINKKVGKNIICTFVPREYREDTGNNRQIHAGGMIMNRPVVSEGPQQVTPPEHLSEQERFMMPPLGDLPRCLYIPGDSRSLPLYKAVHVFPGLVVPELCTTDIVVTIPPVRSTGVDEIEITGGDWTPSFTAKLIEVKGV